MKRTTTLSALILITILFNIHVVLAQPPGKTPQYQSDSCDVDAFVQQQQAYANAMTAFRQVYNAAPDTALLLAYNIGQTYQTFAINCGFIASSADHDHPEVTTDPNNHTPAAHLALALTIGNPDNGQLLFNTIQPPTGFACATCHRVDSTDTLVGPGLITISDPEHDPAHHHGADAAMTMPMTEESGHVERTMEDVVAYMRTSILHPSDFVSTEFLDGLMPQVYGEILSEAQVNDLVAYLLTLHD